MKKILFRTVIKLEILSEDPIPDGMAIAEIIREANEGNYSAMFSEIVSNKIIFGKRAATLVLNQNSYPEFFGMDEDGNEIDE